MNDERDDSQVEVGVFPAGPVTAFRLLGNYDSGPQLSRPGVLRSSQILASQVATEAEAVRIREVLSAQDTYGSRDHAMRCFSPRLGFTLDSGVAALDVLICIECHWAYFFRGDALTTKALSPIGRQRLMALQLNLFPGMTLNQEPETPNQVLNEQKMENLDKSNQPVPRWACLRTSMAILGAIAVSVLSTYQGACAAGSGPGGWNIHLIFVLPMVAVVGLVLALLAVSAAAIVPLRLWGRFLILAGITTLGSYFTAYTLFHHLNTHQTQ